MIAQTVTRNQNVWPSRKKLCTTIKSKVTSQKYEAKETKLKSRSQMGKKSTDCIFNPFSFLLWFKKAQNFTLFSSLTSTWSHGRPWVAISAQGRQPRQLVHHWFLCRTWEEFFDKRFGDCTQKSYDKMRNIFQFNFALFETLRVVRVVLNHFSILLAI